MSVPQEKLPERFGTYRVEALLGRGGMGEIYKAWDERLERHVAIKRVRTDRQITEQQRERFRREARAVARLSHPAIVQIFDVLEEEGGDCIVMELVEGSPLTELIARGELSLLQIINIAREIADGLGDAHAKGLLHRDLKSENVMVTASGHPKILDFGLARALWQDDDREDGGLTASGVLVGTAHAMSPEQIRGDAVDHRSDLFSLGVLLYEMLSGRSPFRGEGPAETLRRLTSDDPTPLHLLHPELPPSLCALTEQLLEKDPADRPPSARVVGSDIIKMTISPELSSFHPVPTRRGRSELPLVEVGEDDPTASGFVPSPATAEAMIPSQSAIRVLVFLDLIDSTRLVGFLGDARAAELSQRHDRLARDHLVRHRGLEIDKTDGFLLLFDRPGDAVAFALDYQRAVAQLAEEFGIDLQARTGIHLGEIILRRNPARDVARGAKPLEVEGLAKPITGRIMALARGRQILLSRSAFDLARRAAVGGVLADPDLQWLAHGAYRLKGLDEPMEIFEVGVAGFSALEAPPDSEKAHRAVAATGELTLGWRPAVQQPIPERPNWFLEQRVGEGGFGEAWLARHTSTGEKRIFKFCFELDRLRALQREATLFRLMKEALGHRNDIARILDWRFDAPPYFLESEYSSGGSLTDWCAEQGGVSEVPLATRLEILAQVAEALAASHSVGVLHKDVKPANVLIRTAPDGTPRIQLTDFGIGLVTDRHKLAARGVSALGLTQDDPEGDGGPATGGSLRYLAPELIEGKPPTIQADIYSLGVMVYQAVVGDFSRALAPGWRRDIDDELLVDDIALLVDGTPERRPKDAEMVAQRLRDLEARRTRRREERRACAAAMEERIRRSRRERRYRVLASLAAGLLILATTWTWQAVRARRQAEELRGRAEGLIQFMLGDLSPRLQELGHLDVLDRVARRSLEYFDALEEGDVAGDTRAHRAEALRQIGEILLYQDELERSEEIFGEARREAQRLLDRDPSAPASQILLAKIDFWLGNVRYVQGDLEGALKGFEAQHGRLRELLDRQPDLEDAKLEFSYSSNNVGLIHLGRGQTRRALDYFETGLGPIRELVAADPTRTEWRLQEAHTWLRIGEARSQLGELERAYHGFHNHLGILRALHDEDPESSLVKEQLAVSHNQLGSMLEDLGFPERAVDHHRRHVELARELVSISDDHAIWKSSLAAGHLNLGRVLFQTGHRDAARRQLASAIAIRTGMLDENPANRGTLLGLVTVRNELARQLLVESRLDEALQEAERGLVRIDGFVPEGEHDPRMLSLWSEALVLRGQALARRGDLAGARTSWATAHRLLAGIPPESMDFFLLRRWALAVLYHESPQAAAPLVERLFAAGLRRLDFVDECQKHGLAVPADRVELRGGLKPAGWYGPC